MNINWTVVNEEATASDKIYLCSLHIERSGGKRLFYLLPQNGDKEMGLSAQFTVRDPRDEMFWLKIFCKKLGVYKILWRRNIVQKRSCAQNANKEMRRALCAQNDGVGSACLGHTERCKYKHKQNYKYKHKQRQNLNLNAQNSVSLPLLWQRVLWSNYQRYRLSVGQPVGLVSPNF